MSPLTSAECLAIAERKMAEAMGDRRHGKELKLTAQAWMVLAENVKQAEALEVAKVAPDLASTAVSSHCSSLKQIAGRHPGLPPLSSCKLPERRRTCRSMSARGCSEPLKEIALEYDRIMTS